MGKSTKTYEERIQEKDLRIEKLAQEFSRKSESDRTESDTDRVA